MSGADPILLMAWVGAIVGPPSAVLVWRRGRRWPVVRFGLYFLAVAYLVAVWAFLIEPEMLVVRHVSVASANWRGPPLRIGLLSDTHVGAHVSPARVARVISRLSNERPDVVVLLGDYAGGHLPSAARSAAERSAIMAGVAVLADANAPFGRVAVLGNHDWWFDGLAIEAVLQKGGVPVLENAAIRVPRPSGPFWIAGLADLASQRAEPRPDLALRRVPLNEPVIVLTHWPDPWPSVPDRVALTLAGHTHCGQVNLPLVGRLVAASPGSRRWGCGLYKDRGRKLFVTGGVGTSILPVRFRAPPEFVILTLSQAPQSLTSHP